MPTYTVTVANLSLSPQQKSQIAEAITAAHNAQTGAPRFFTHVLLFTANEGDHFLSGRVNNDPQVYVHGLVREGRSIAIKKSLIKQMLEKITQLLKITA